MFEKNRSDQATVGCLVDNEESLTCQMINLGRFGQEPAGKSSKDDGFKGNEVQNICFFRLHQFPQPDADIYLGKNIDGRAFEIQLDNSDTIFLQNFAFGTLFGNQNNFVVFLIQKKLSNMGKMSMEKPVFRADKEYFFFESDINCHLTANIKNLNWSCLQGNGGIDIP